MSRDDYYEAIARTVANLGDMRRLEPIEVAVPTHWKEWHLEVGIAEWLSQTFPHLRVYQQVNWGTEIPDIVAVSDTPWLHSVTVIEVKRKVIKPRDVDQIIRYMPRAGKWARRTGTMWSVQGILAAPSIRDGLELPNWCSFLQVIPVVTP